MFEHDPDDVQHTVYEPVEVAQLVAEATHHVVRATLQIAGGMEVPSVKATTAVVETKTQPQQDASDEARHEPPAVELGLRDDRQESVQQPAEQRDVRDQIMPHLAGRLDE